MLVCFGWMRAKNKLQIKTVWTLENVPLSLVSSFYQQLNSGGSEAVIKKMHVFPIGELNHHMCLSNCT